MELIGDFDQSLSKIGVAFWRAERGISDTTTTPPMISSMDDDLEGSKEITCGRKDVIHGDKDEEVENHLGSCKNSGSHFHNTTSLTTKLTSKITGRTKIIDATDRKRTKPQIIIASTCCTFTRLNK